MQILRSYIIDAKFNVHSNNKNYRLNLFKSIQGQLLHIIAEKGKKLILHQY